MAYIDESRRGSYLGELHSVKVYEMHIFKDDTKTWETPTVHAIPIEPESVNELLSPVSLRTLRRLPAEQLTFLAKHLKEMNQKLHAPPPPPPPEPVSDDKLPPRRNTFDSMDASTMIYTPSGPTGLPPMAPQPPPLPPASYPVYTSTGAIALPPPPPFRDPAKYCERDWVLESVDFDVTPATIYRRSTNDTYFGPREDMEVGVKTFDPAPLAYEEFTAVYSRWVPSRADDIEKHDNGNSLRRNSSRRLPIPYSPVSVVMPPPVRYPAPHPRSRNALNEEEIWTVKNEVPVRERRGRCTRGVPRSRTPVGQLASDLESELEIVDDDL